MISFKKIIDLLSPSERHRALLLLGMILVMALLDVVGVASIMPFMAVLTNPDLIHTNPILSAAFKNLGMARIRDFQILLGMATLGLIVLSLTFKALTTYAQLRFALMREFSIGKRLVEGYLRQPYTWFLDRHSADLGKTILSEVNVVIYQAVLPSITIVAQGTATIALLTLLVVTDLKLALIIGLVLGLSYMTILKATRQFLSRIGAERVTANQKRFLAISEAFGAIKEVKVRGLENNYISRFAKPAESYAKLQASALIVGQIPRYAIEAVAMGGMLLVTLYLLSRSGDLSTTLPMIALYAFAGYRLMPSLQQIYSGLSQLRFSAPALDALHSDLSALSPSRPEPAEGRLSLQQQLVIENLHFSYSNSAKSALNNISLSIAANTTVGLVGTTGCGKTTLVDIILGLLTPQKGKITVDGQIIDINNLRKWQRSIGYVPQNIYLADDTVASNIAFGVPAELIDMEAVIKAAKIANLHDFVSNELPQNYSTKLGERGVRLSGGQRQRIGIARALYQDPDILILDEATSALDSLTEQAVMDAINDLGRRKTIIVVAHRLNTIRKCDRIYLLDSGEVGGQGTYDELAISSTTFQKMIGKS